MLQAVISAETSRSAGVSKGKHRLTSNVISAQWNHPCQRCRNGRGQLGNSSWMCWGECHAKCHDIHSTGMLITANYSVLGVQTNIQTPLQRATGAAFPQQFCNLCSCGQDLEVFPRSVNFGLQFEFCQELLAHPSRSAGMHLFPGYWRSEICGL